MSICALLALPVLAQPVKPFVHPGILQSRQDLEFMKAKVKAGEQPWKQAWENLRARPFSSLDFQPRPVAHIARGGYGANSAGDRDLMASADAAYSHALQWSITGDRAHARKAIAILEAWSATLWDFEGNDAKLLAGWTAGAFCNAAEILRYTDSGWDAAGVDRFKRFLKTVYYPVLKDYFPEANGNWDAAIIEALMSIGIFCDDRAIFGSARVHYLRGTGNGGLTRYIYPSGQCDENTRDQGHTQLGLGYFARAARVAWTQGVDLWSTADDRLALGFEYTARYMLGEDVEAYGRISPQGRGQFSDIYEAVYQHYHFAKGFEMPATRQAMEKAREKGWWALVMHRGGPAHPVVVGPVPGRQAPGAGAQARATAQAPAGSLQVAAGESIQEALDRQAARGGGWVVLAAGVHTIQASLRMPSGVTLAGQGRESIVYFDPKARAGNVAVAIVNGSDDLHDATLRDFVVEGSTLVRAPSDPNSDHRVRSHPGAPVRAGISFAAQKAGQMRRLRFEHLTVRNCTHQGVAIRGAAEVAVVASDFSDNGGSVVPGPGLQHNLLITRTAGASVTDSRLDDSPWGSGLAVSFSRGITVKNTEAARNGAYGIEVADSEGVRIEGSLAEGNDRGGIEVMRLYDAPKRVEQIGNVSRNNGGAGR